MEVREILENIGYTNIKEDARTYRMKPLYRDSSSDTVLSVMKDTGSFIDFSKNISGSLKDLIKMSLDFKTEDEAIQWLEKNTDGLVLKPKQEKPIIKETKMFSKDCLEKLIKDHSYWNNRGVSNQALELFQGGVVKAGKMKNRYVFPIFDYQQNLVGVSGRDLVNDPESKRPKWKHIGDKSQWKYPMQVNNKIIRQSREVIVVESIGDMLALWDAGIQNTAVAFGLQVGLGLLNYFIRVDVDKIILALNNDASNNNAGNEAAQKNLNRLTRYFDHDQIQIALPEQGDFGDMSLEQILNWKSNL
jgi:hypothetical protein